MNIRSKLILCFHTFCLRTTIMLLFSVILVLSIFGQQTFADEPERIFGGSIAARDEFPYQCSINYNYNNDSFCGCSIINEMQVLTAAHCVYDSQSPYEHINIATGSIFSDAGDSHAIKTIRIHPEYKSGLKHSWQNDIAVITLQKPIVFHIYQSSVPLSTTRPNIGTPCNLAGWGLTETWKSTKTLLKIHTMIIGNEACQSIYQNPIHNSHVCTLKKKGFGACRGDSGGPLVCNGQQVGIISFVVPCALGVPDVYTDVSHYHDFIREARADAYIYM